MKPAAFDYARPASVDEAIALLAREDLAVKLLAGGQSLGPMLNLRLAQPQLLVDITGIPELRRIEEDAEGITVGACLTHADFEDGRVPDVTGGALAKVARGIAYRAVRNRGTIGGSIAHADPSADWITSLAAMGAEVLLRGPAGARRMGIADFVTGVFEVALQPCELLEAVRIPRLSPAARWGYYKYCRKTGELALAAGAVLYDPDRSVWRAVIGATEARPVVFADAAPLFGGAASLDAARFDAQAASQALAAAGMGDAVDRQMHVVALRRAVERASMKVAA
jgi:carbon-monoxide dehydrogenase medium subunit